MPGTTPINGITFPYDRTDAPLGGYAMERLARDIDPRLNAVFANVAARDAAIPKPTEGMECYLARQTNPTVLPPRKMIYSDGTWRLLGPPSLPAIVGAWTEPPGDFGFINGYMEITRLTLPDLGFPYRVQARARGEIGAVANSGTRVDMQLWLQYPDGGAYWGQIDTAQGVEPAFPGHPDGVSYQQITSGLVNQVFTGRMDVVIRAFRVYGESVGRVTGFYRQLTATQWAA